MKHFYLFLVVSLVLLFSKNGQAQDYLPITKDSAFWFYEANENVITFVERYVIFMNGDTSINNLLYKKLYFKAENDQSPKLIAAVRDDYALERTYTVLFTHSLTGGLSLNLTCPLYTEMVLYDFNVEINDALMNDCHESGVISGISTQFFYERDRRVFSLANIEQTWYEGIGSLSGFFNAFVNSDDYQLTNYCEGSFNDCNVQLFLNTDFIPLNELGKIFPNPVQNTFTLQLSKAVYNAEIIFSDIYGQKIGGSTINGTEKKLDISHLASGVYFIEVLKDRKLVFKDKLVVVK